METFVINKKQIDLPTSWEDCNFNRFLQFSKLIDSFGEKEKKEIKTDSDEWEQTLEDLKDNTKILSFWCELPESEISLLDLEVANEIMTSLGFLNDSYVPITIDSFTIGDEKFYLPKDFMRQSSFGRYIEAEQLELQTNMLEKGRIEVLPKQIAILCKKEGEEEKLDDDLIEKRAEMFKELDMATIWDVGFFLNKLEQKLMLNFLISQEKEEMPKQELPQKEQ